MSDFILCYVDSETAWFVNTPLDQVWGDDWNDAPYEHNAGDPYQKDGQELIKIRYDGGWLETPAEIANGNSCYSVEAINKGAAPWLTNVSTWNKPKTPINIFAGVTVDEFKRLVWLSDGNIYERTPRPPALEADHA